MIENLPETRYLIFSVNHLSQNKCLTADENLSSVGHSVLTTRKSPYG